MNRKTFDTDYLVLAIDPSRMPRGKDVAKRLRPSDAGGIPWMAILDEEGKTLATSDGPQGNIGYPAQPAEIEHFMGMLKKTVRKLTPEQLAEIEKALGEAAKKYRSR